jgi:hypothetical protein
VGAFVTSASRIEGPLQKLVRGMSRPFRAKVSKDPPANVPDTRKTDPSSQYFAGFCVFRWTCGLVLLGEYFFSSHMIDLTKVSLIN